MKKLMFAVAAVAAGVALADVTSANVVGYLNKGVANETATKTIKRMLGGSFVNVGENSLYITDLKFTGYQEGEWYHTHSLNNLFMCKLNNSGKTEMTYTWQDSWDEEQSKWTGGYWQWKDAEGNTGTVEKGGAYDIELTRGAALWCTIAAKRDSSDIYLATAGEALLASQPVACANETATKTIKRGLGNPIAKPCKLSQVSFTGYQEGEWYHTHSLNNLFICKLNNSGKTEMTYTWQDSWDDEHSVWTGGYWQWKDAEGNTGTVVPDSADDITINPGDSFWCTIAARRDSTDIYLLWPGVGVE